MRGKGRSSVILIKSFNPFLAPVVLGAVAGFHHLMAHGTTVGGISSSAPETFLQFSGSLSAVDLNSFLIVDVFEFLVWNF